METEVLADITNSPLSDGRQRRSSMGQTPNSKGRRRSLIDSSSKADHKAARDRRKSRLGGRNLADDIENQKTPGHTVPSQDLLNVEQVSALYQQCIKLATENKITSKNTWALGLIDHLHDLVKPNDQEGTDTNFQRASITLGAGVEIYSKRVDSIHTAAYKVLSGLSKGRGSGEDDGEENEDETQGEDGSEPAKENSKAARRAAMLRDVDPSSTLESSFDALNVKKFDLAFAVDPLFQRTSAQFDEGGAKGLLLNNLGVYNGCEILFDSQEVPMNRQDTEASNVMVDLGTLRDRFEEVHQAAENGARICPAMDEMYAILGQPPEDHYIPEIEALMGSLSTELPPVSHSLETSVTDDGGQDTGNFDPGDSDNEEAFQDAFDGDFGEAGMAEDLEEGPHEDGPNWMTQEAFDSEISSVNGPENTQSYDDTGGEAGGNLEEISGLSHEEASNNESSAVAWLISGVQNLSLEGKAWAGSSHWHYRTRGKENEDPKTSSQPKPRATRKKGEPFDFFNLPELPENALAIADPKDITLKNWPAKANTLLPEDLHYKTSQLFELFLIPGIPFHETPFYRGSKSKAQPSRQPQNEDSDFEDYGNDQYDDGNDGEGAMDGWGDVNFEGATDLIDAPRKVAQIGINYARASKQVDVKALKQTLWQCIGEEYDKQQRSNSEANGLSFNHVLSKLSANNVVGNLQDLSVHLCFICLLHLANENGLRITGAGNLDQILIWDIPSASIV